MEKWRVPQSIWPKPTHRSPFVSLRMKANITTCYHSVRTSTRENWGVFSVCLYCHCFMKLCGCKLWLDVLENSQGEEPFISQASAITEACSHRHNHLLELLEIGSPKRYGLGVHHFIQGNLCRCHSNKILFPVLAESLGGKCLLFHVHWAEHLEYIFFVENWGSVTWNMTPAVGKKVHIFINSDTKGLKSVWISLFNVDVKEYVIGFFWKAFQWYQCKAEISTGNNTLK